MHALSLQLSVLLVGLFLIGLSLGWWLAIFFQRPAKDSCYQELIRLRHIHQRLQNDHIQLNTRLTACEQENNQLNETLKTATDLQIFEQVRTQLMLTRQQLHNTQQQLNKREQQLKQVIDLARLLKRQVKPIAPALCLTHRTENLASSKYSLHLLPELDQEARMQLERLGILSCEQLAQFNPEQLKQTQSLLSQNKIMPLAKWVRQARELIEQSATAASNAKPPILSHSD